jgi:hypothetical protein
LGTLQCWNWIPVGIGEEGEDPEEPVVEVSAGPHVDSMLQQRADVGRGGRGGGPVHFHVLEAGGRLHQQALHQAQQGLRQAWLPSPCSHMMCKVYRTVVGKIGCTEFGSISERKVTAATNRHYITELKGLSHEIDFKSFDKSLQD